MYVVRDRTSGGSSNGNGEGRTVVRDNAPGHNAWVAEAVPGREPWVCGGLRGASV